MSMSNPNTGPDEERQLVSLLELGTDIAGGVAGAAIGYLVGGPQGAVIGAAAQPLVVRGLRHSAVEAIHRQLSRREQTRVAAVVAYAAVRIQRNLTLGYEPRHDGFFQDEPGNRSAAEELADGVLLSAQREHEEIDRGLANLLLRQAEDLSYRQICLLALFGRKDAYPELRDGSLYEVLAADLPGSQYIELVGLLEETERLVSSGLLAQRSGELSSSTGINPADIELQYWGRKLYQVMHLSEIPAAELQPLADRFV